MLHALHVDAHAARAAGDVRTAASRSAAVRSGIFVLAISSACARVSLPTLSVCGFGLPFSMLAAFLISTVAGGVLMMNVKLLSAYAVITTGSGRPGSTFCVCALNALQNSMMLRPRWPSAGSDRRRGIRLARRHLQLDEADDFLCHASLLVGASGRRAHLR